MVPEDTPEGDSEVPPADTPGDETTLIRSAPSVLDHVASVTRVRPGVQLRDAEGNREARVPKPLDAGESRAAGKYVLRGELGRGGVGAVHRGHDQDLGRDVAIKFLHDRFKNHPSILHRFVEEAQIGGQLQHPGIVPVYDLGMSDGKPFFAMKLIKGETLAKMLTERESPATDRRGFLAIFEQVCQTIAYAHARGVVHRDLKPANIMIGSFGEVQVVDWGMGKVLGQDSETAEARAEVSVVETVRSSGEGTQSVMGSIMGTPAYMPPEQAMGRTDQMDERSDVFALGAILCEILTGKPPYVGPVDGLIEMAADCRLDDARERLAECDADPAVIELATSCLRAAPAARPKDAEAVAERIHTYLGAAEHAVHAARVAAAEERVRARAARARQKLAFGLAGVVALASATAVWFWMRANASLANFNRLSYVVRLETAKAKERVLFPAWPRQAVQMRRWLDNEAKELRDAVPELRATLAALGPPGAGRATAAESVDDFLRSTLLTLVADIAAFEKAEVAAVEQRLAWANRVEELTVGRHAELWNEARIAIMKADGTTASKLYGATPIELKPQTGLVPIGMNPRTSLWEFYHLRSAWKASSGRDPGAIRIPSHAADGALRMRGRGIVFVLIPGGKFFMGAQRTDPDGQNFDSAANDNEAPVREVDVAPYFLARYELTQGQWARLTGGDYPSFYKLGELYTGNPMRITDASPVENVSFVDCTDLLAQHELSIPTEAQWERACRAGTSTPWFAGKTAGDLAGVANALDKTARETPPVWAGGEDFDDGFKITAPVGTYAPNAFGLHDVHGNVWEWCRPKPGSSADPVYRGGSYQNPARLMRSAYRYRVVPTTRHVHLGVRPARRVQE